MNNQNNIINLADHLFRHESGKMVSVLIKIFGTQNMETAEDVVQQTFIDAIGVWKLKGIPNNPSAWLFRVAKNKAIDIIRRNKHSVQYDFSDDERTMFTSEYTLSATMENIWQDGLVKDDMLRMMFACCHPEISEENQITIILKLLCGFSTAEIAKAFITSEESVSKRLYRTKEFFRNGKIKLELPSVAELKGRTHAVLNSIYLLFNEGYNSTHSNKLIRQDLINEAMMLCKLLIENKHTKLPEACALMSLMCFHAARSESRLTAEGEIILLSNQDRSNWNLELIAEGNRYLNIAAFGNEVSNYHIEAAIAFEHCTAESYEKTDWNKILNLYEWLCSISSSPIIHMNKTVATMHAYGAEKAFLELQNISDRKQLEAYYLYHSLLGHLFTKLGDKLKAKSSFQTAIGLTKSDIEKRLLHEKISRLDD